MKKIIPLLVASLAWGSNAVLINEYVKAGVNETTGTFGSGNNTPPGLQYDSTGTGTFNNAYDYLTPGSPFDGFTVKNDNGTWRNNNAGNLAQIAGGWTGSTSSSSAVWSGGVAGQFSMINTYSLPSGQPYVDINTQITSLVATSNLYFGRYIDPDARAAAGDSSATDNTLGYGAIPRSNVVFSEALVSRYALGLYSTDRNVTSGVSPSWSTNPTDYNYNSTIGATNRGDYTIGLGWTVHGVSAGDIINFHYAYIFGPSAFGAASTAISGGAGGGDSTILTGTLTDVGSASTAATTPVTPPAPTVTSTSTQTISSSSNSVDTSLPVLSASVTHHTSALSGNVQNITRDVTTTTTTPMLTTTSSFVRTTTNYSDGSSTVSNGATTTTNALWNDVVLTNSTLPTLTGRIDGMSSLYNVNKLVNRTFNDEVQGVQAIKHSISFKNSSTANVDGYAFGGSTKVKDIKLGATLGVFDSKMSSELNGTSKSSVLSVYGVKEFDKVTAKLSYNYVDTSYNSNRTIGDFSNTSSTDGKDKFANLTFTGKYAIEPIVGYTVGKRNLVGFSEQGSIQSALTFDPVNDSYRYYTIGAQKTLGDFVIKGVHYTDNISDYSVVYGKEFGRARLNLQVQRLISDFASDTSIKAGLLIKF